MCTINRVCCIVVQFDIVVKVVTVGFINVTVSDFSFLLSLLIVELVLVVQETIVMVDDVYDLMVT